MARGPATMTKIAVLRKAALLAGLLLLGAGSTFAGNTALLPPDRDASANLAQRRDAVRWRHPEPHYYLRHGQPAWQREGRHVQHSGGDRWLSCRSGGATRVLLNKSVTLRGAGAGSTILTRTDGAKLGSYNISRAPARLR
jgi:hypothetical protein